MRLSSVISVRVQNAWFAARDEESGQTLVEYGLIIAIVGIAAIAAVGFFSGKVQGLLWQAGSSVGDAA